MSRRPFRLATSFLGEVGRGKNEARPSRGTRHLNSD